MQSDSFPLILFVVSIGILLFGIIRLKINPFLVLLAVSIFIGLASGLPITKVTKLLTDGFGMTMGNIGQTLENPVMIGLAICCGSICMSFPNDSGFWVISRYSGLTVAQNLRMLTLKGTITGDHCFFDGTGDQCYVVKGPGLVFKRIKSARLIRLSIHFNKNNRL